MFQISDIYENAKRSDTKLLSDFNADFWNAYNTDHEKFDALFNRKFYSFRYFNQKEGQDIDEVTANFISDVYLHLLVNNKKYAELFRIEDIDDDDYNIKYNYVIKEKTITDSTDNKRFVSGSRNDSGSDTVGQRTDKVTTNYDEIANTVESDNDAIENVSIDKVSPYDGDNVNLSTKTSTTDNLGKTHNKTEDTTEARTDVVDSISGQQINSNSYTKGEQTNTDSDTFHEQIDFSREGNIGTISVDDMLAKHKNFWNPWNFYEIIFNDICKELLLV